jgi:tetratricopeptide (TPR) repeat protein
MTTHPFFLFTALLAITTALHAAPLDEAEQHLQAREYQQAAAKLSGIKGNDRAAYLHAKALFLDQKFPAAEQAATAFLKDHADSAWTAKTRFLLARALIEQQKHKAAEAIYAAEAERVFSTERKQGLAKRLIEFADKLSTEPAPTDLDALPADHAKALGLYQQVLAMEITRDLRDDILFKTGIAQGEIKQNDVGIATFRSYLDQFDPTWTGAVGSPERKRGQLKESPEAAGRKRLEARLELVKLQMTAQDFTGARQNADDLLVLAGKERPKDKLFLAEVRLQRIFSFESSGTVEQKIEARREFLSAHSDHEKAHELARWIAVIYQLSGRSDDAVAAYNDFLTAKNYKFVADDKATTPDPDTGVSPAARLEQWKQRRPTKLDRSGSSSSNTMPPSRAGNSMSLITRMVPSGPPRKVAS